MTNEELARLHERLAEQDRAIKQLHAAVKAAQELAAARLTVIERLHGLIDSRDRALGFVPLDEVHASEPSEQPDYQHLYQCEVASKMVLQGEYDSLKSDLHAVSNATETLEALKTAHQALLEVRHAQECGPGWYTRGEAGLFQQTSMWIRRGLDALNKTRPDWQPTQSRTSE